MARRFNASGSAAARTTVRTNARRAQRARERTPTPPHDAIGKALQVIAHLVDHVPGEALEQYRELWQRHRTDPAQSAIEQHSEHENVEASLDEAFEHIYVEGIANKNLRSMVRIVQRHPFRWHEELSGARLYAILGDSGVTRPFLEAFRGLERIAIRTSSSQSNTMIEEEVTPMDAHGERGLTFQEAMEVLAEAQKYRQTKSQRGASKDADWQPVDCAYAEKLARERWDCVDVAPKRKSGARKLGARENSASAAEDTDETTNITEEGTTNDQSHERGDTGDSGLSSSPGGHESNGYGIDDVTAGAADHGEDHVDEDSDTSPQQEIGRRAPLDLALYNDVTDSQAFSFVGDSPLQSQSQMAEGASQLPSELRSSNSFRFHFTRPGTHPTDSTQFSPVPSNTGLDASGIVNHDLLPSDGMPMPMSMSRRKRAASPSPLQHGTGLTSRFKRTRLASRPHNAEQPPPSRKDYLEIAHSFLSRFASPGVAIVEADAVLVLEDELPCGILLLATDSANSASADEDSAPMSQQSDTSWSVVYFEVSSGEAPVLDIYYNTAQPIVADLQARVCAIVDGKVTREVSAALTGISAETFLSSCRALPELDKSERGEYGSEYVDFARCVAVMIFLVAAEEPPPEALFLWAWLGAFAVCEQSHSRVSQLSEAVELPLLNKQDALTVSDTADYEDGCKMVTAGARHFRQQVEENNCQAEALRRFSDHLKRIRRCVEAATSSQSSAGADEIDKRIEGLTNAKTHLPPTETTLLFNIEAKITRAKEEKATLARQRAESAALRELKAWIDWSVGEADAKRDKIVAANSELVHRIKSTLESALKDLEDLYSGSEGLSRNV